MTILRMSHGSVLREPNVHLEICHLRVKENCHLLTNMHEFIAEVRSFAEMEYIIFEESYLANCGSRYCLVINIEKFQCSEYWQISAIND